MAGHRAEPHMAIGGRLDRGQLHIPPRPLRRGVAGEQPGNPGVGVHRHDHRLEHRHVHMVAPPAAPRRPSRGQRPHPRIHPRRPLPDSPARLHRRTLWVPPLADPPALALQSELRSRPPRIRPRAPPRRDRHHHQRRIGPPRRRNHFRRQPRLRPVNHHIGPSQQPSNPRIVHLPDNRPLRRVQKLEQRPILVTQLRPRRRPPPQRLPTRRLHLHHISPRISQQLPRIRPRDPPTHLNHPQVPKNHGRQGSPRR